jgi:cell division protein FtsB
MSLKPLYFKIGLAAALIFLAAYFAVTVFGKNGLMEVNRKQQHLSRIQAENTRIEKENRRLYRRLSRLKNDPAYLEHMIRQQLCVVSKDQFVFKFGSGN